MKIMRRCMAAALCALTALPLRAETGASWLRAGAPANVLNPNLSVIADLVGAAGPRGDGGANRFSLREAEVGLQANVDPYARADFFIAFPEGETAEVEEGYVTLLHLPAGLLARGGKLKANFGRMNMIHGHERPQVDAPFVVADQLGEEGLREVGVEASRVFAPFGLFTEVSYGLLNGLGEEEAEPETASVQLVDGAGNPLLDVNGDPLVKDVTLAEERANRPRTLRNFAHVARVRSYADLSDAANVEWGISGALHQPAEGKQVTLAGADLTFRWRPPQAGLYQSFLWRTEGIYSHRVLPAAFDVTGLRTSDRRRLDRRGAYSYVEWQPARRWRLGLRGDYSESPEARGESFVLSDGTPRQVDKSIRRALSPCVTFTWSEFHRLRLEVQHETGPSGEAETRGWLQWTVILGPHGAHAF